MSDFFYGWYMKCQSSVQTLAVIPAVHQVNRIRSCSIQIITDQNAWNVNFPWDAYQRSGKRMTIGENQFGENGIRLAIHTPGVVVNGRVDFGPLTPLAYDIMGPFALVPFLECRHRIWSMQHTVSGSVSVNEQEYSFQNSCGYWEGDRGRSFPKTYAWTQCCFFGGSIMLAAADIPVAGIHFTGITGAVLWEGKEYRLATYLGAKAVKIHRGRLKIVQRDLELDVRLFERTGHPLKAPVNGSMMRTIHENAACRAFYRLCKNGHVLFEFETDRASFEYEIDSHYSGCVTGCRNR